MKTIFITISRGSLIRNFFQSGVIGKILHKGIRVVVLTPNYNDKELWKEYVHKNLFFEPLVSPKKINFRILIHELQMGAVFNDSIKSLYLYRVDGADIPKRIYYIPRMVVMAP